MSPVVVRRAPAPDVLVRRGSTPVLAPRAAVPSVLVNVNRQVLSGGGSAPSVFDFAALVEWIINHNLGYQPPITILSPGGVEVGADVRHITTNQSRVYFNNPYAGRALVG